MTRLRLVLHRNTSTPLLQQAFMLHRNKPCWYPRGVSAVTAAPGVDRYFELSSGTLRARVHGDQGSAKQLAIGVPGLSANCFTFNRLGPAVAQLGRQLVALDLRGRGRSPPGKSGTHGWANHARDVLAVADSMGTERFDFIGHSMGAFVGLALMQLAPLRVRTLTLIDAVGVPDSRAMPPILGAAQRLGAVYPSVDAFLALVKGVGVVPWDDFWEAHYREDLVETEGGVRQRASKEAVIEDLQYAATTDVRALWPHVVCQSLLIRAGQPFAPGADIITQSDRDAFLSTATRSRSTEVAANHYGVMNHPQTAAAVQELLT
jgi:3-oxoadipate enol-lactonase